MLELFCVGSGNPVWLKPTKRLCRLCWSRRPTKGPGTLNRHMNERREETKTLDKKLREKIR
jgi:hypothetical protein